MGKAILAAVSTLVIGILVMSIFPAARELGLLAAISVMGAFILYFGEKKE